MAIFKIPIANLSLEKYLKYFLKVRSHGTGVAVIYCSNKLKMLTLCGRGTIAFTWGHCRRHTIRVQNPFCAATLPQPQPQLCSVNESIVYNVIQLLRQKNRSRSHTVWTDLKCLKTQCVIFCRHMCSQTYDNNLKDTHVYQKTSELQFYQRYWKVRLVPGNLDYLKLHTPKSTRRGIQHNKQLQARIVCLFSGMRKTSSWSKNWYLALISLLLLFSLFKFWHDVHCSFWSSIN